MPGPSRPTERLTDAVIALLLEDGFEGVTVRRVATTAGVSIGAVQHHFPTKAAMLEAVMSRISAEFGARLESRAGSSRDPRVILRVLADELLGAGEERRTATVLWLLRLARATVDPDVAAAHAREWQQVEDLLTGVIAACRPDQADNWWRERAAELLALLDGLAASVLTEPQRMPRERAESMVAAAVDRVLSA